MISTLGHLKPNYNNTAALDLVKPYDQSTWHDWRASCLFQVLSSMQVSSLADLHCTLRNKRGT